MDFSKLIDRITESNSIQPISIDDYPKHNQPDMTLKDSVSPKWEEFCNNVKSCVCNNDEELQIRNTVISIIKALSLAGIIAFFLAGFGVIALNKWSCIRCEDKWLNYIFVSICLILILVAAILLFYKYMKFQSRKSEIAAKQNEKMIDNIVAAFNEEREYCMLQTKMEISLYEKSERARIEQWERNKEHEREMRKRELERREKIRDVLIELAKIHNKITKKILYDEPKQPKDSKKPLETIEERSILTV